MRECKSRLSLSYPCRLSKEVGSENNNETINWLEIKHAVEKKQNLPCKCLLLLDHVHV